MTQINAACLSTARTSGANADNLLFAEQILPEINGGLAGVPALSRSADEPLIAAVFDGTAADGARSAHYAAKAFHSTLEPLASGGAPGLLLDEIGKRLAAAGAPAVSAAAISLRNGHLLLADTGFCRAYLYRGNAMYLLSRSTAPSDRAHTAGGVMHSGDRLLLCTDGLYEAMSEAEILRILSSDGSPAAVLTRLEQRAREKGAADSITAILLCAEG